MKSLRALYFSLCCLLAAFYGYVAYLAVHPNVSLFYRLYYVDKTLRYWNRGQGLGYTLGDSLDFTKPVQYLSVKGWSHPEATGTWSDGSPASLYFVMQGGERPSEIKIAGTPFLAPDKGIKSQRILAFANDAKLGEVTIATPSDQEISFAIPPSVQLADGDLLVIRFEFPDAVSPKSLGISDDARPLAFWFRTLVMR